MEEQDHESTTFQDFAIDLKQVKMADNDDINKFDERTPALKALSARQNSNSFDKKHEIGEPKSVGSIKNHQPVKQHTEGNVIHLPEENSNENLLQEDNVHAESKNNNVAEQDEDEKLQAKDNVLDKEGDIVQKQIYEENMHEKVEVDIVHVSEEEGGASGKSEEAIWYPPSGTMEKKDQAVVQQIGAGNKDEELKGLRSENVGRKSQSKEKDRKPQYVAHGRNNSDKSRRGIQRPYDANGHERQSRDWKDIERKRPQNECMVKYYYTEEKNSAASYREKPMEEKKTKKKKWWNMCRDLPDERDKYEYFWRRESVFSQWYRCEFKVDGITYNCTEQYMMHQKAVLMKDMERADIIMALDEPREMKQQGRYVENFDQKYWGKCCQDVVERGNMEKFSQNKELKEQLINTFPKILVEASPMDKIWGIGLSKDDPKAWNKKTWRGRNLLGEALTKVRNDLMKKEEQETGRNGEKGPVKETSNEEKQEVGTRLKGGKGPVKETINKEEQEGDRKRKKGLVKETIKKGEEEEIGRTGEKDQSKEQFNGTVNSYLSDAEAYMLNV